MPGEARCDGSELVWQHSSPWLTVGMPVCCPRCGQQVTLVPDREDVPASYVLPMSPVHDRPSDETPVATVEGVAELAPGDIVLLRTRDELSAAELEVLLNSLEDQFPEVRFAILGPGIEVSVLRPDKPDRVVEEARRLSQ